MPLFSQRLTTPLGPMFGVADDRGLVLCEFHDIAIIVPCHRVINADGSLSGYGGGRHRKRWLLAHEKRGVQLSLAPDWD